MAEHRTFNPLVQGSSPWWPTNSNPLFMWGIPPSWGPCGLDAVDWSLAAPFTVTMLIGSFVGSLLGHRLPTKDSLRAFATLLVLVALGNGIVSGARAPRVTCEARACRS